MVSSQHLFITAFVYTFLALDLCGLVASVLEDLLEALEEVLDIATGCEKRSSVSFVDAFPNTYATHSAHQ